MNKRIYWVGLLSFIFAPAAAAQRIDLWNDPRAEAEYLALEVSNDLRPLLPLADQIEADLAAIRLSRPDLIDIHVFPSWLPGELLVGFTPAAYADFKNGTFTGFDSLYAMLGTPQVGLHDFGQWAHLQFGQIYHGVRLAELFQGINGLRYAEPNGTLGDGNDIVARADRTYTLSRGFGDCPAGCIHRESWDFTVTNQGVFPRLAGNSVPGDSGDFNQDGFVDAADYVLWRRGIGTIYNESHYAAWRGHFGANVGLSGNLIAAPIPEPGSALLLALSVALLGLNRDRRS
jgi:hypothetical protein